MEYNPPKIDISGKKYELITPGEFITRKGEGEIITHATLNYQYKNDKLDFVSFFGTRLIVWNDKAQNFQLTQRGRKHKHS